MKLRLFTLILLMCLLLALLISCTNTEGSSKSKNDISAAKKEFLPVYFAKGDVKYYSRGDAITGVFYSSKLPHSKQAAEVVLEFYDKKMKQLGFKPYVEDYYKYGDRIWQDFIDGTMKNKPHIAQLNASWVDDTKTKRGKFNFKILLVRR